MMPSVYCWRVWSDWPLSAAFFFMSFYGLANFSLSVGEIGLLIIFVCAFFFKNAALPLGWYLSLVLALFFQLIPLVYNYPGELYHVVRAVVFLFTSFFIIAVIWFNNSKIYLIVDALLLSLWVHFIFCFFQLVLPEFGFYFMEVDQRSSVLGGELYRCSGLFHNPNSLALYASVLAPLAVWRNRIIYLYVCLLLVVITFSKTGALLFVLTPLLLVLYYRFKIVYLLPIMLVVLLMLYPVFSPYFDRLISIINYRLVHAESFDSRFDVYSDAINSLCQHLFVGLGPMQDFFGGEVRVHNRVLSIAVQYGVVISFALCFLFIVLLWKSIRFSIYWFLSLVNFAALSLFHTLTYFQAEYVVVWLAIVVLFKNPKHDDSRTECL